MSEVKTMRLNKVLREFNISLDRAVEFLSSKGYEVESRPTTKISNKEYQVMFEEFQTDKSKKVASKEVGEEKRKEKEDIRLASERELEERKQKIEASRKVIKAEVKLEGPKTLGKIDLNTKKPSENKKETVKKELDIVV
jgi:translation initiation factor IF-2